MSTHFHHILRIVRGKSRFPLRVVDSDRFLIGAGSSCQLRLSSEEIPMIYAVLSPEMESCKIEALHPFPPLMVNSQPLRQAQLLPGDRVSFGPYELEFLMQPTSQEQLPTLTQHSVSSAPSKQAVLFIPELPVDLGELSARDLVDRIELELELLEQFGDYDDLVTEQEQYTNTSHPLPRKSA